MKLQRFFSIILTLCTAGLSAQNSDWGVRTGIEVEKKLNKKWEIGFGGEYRWKEGMSLTDQIRGSFETGYKPWKFLKIGAGYELIADKKKKRDSYINRHRFKLDATGSYKYGRFTANWRPRLQITLYDDDDVDDDEPDNYRWVMRNRFGLNYNIPKIPVKPYIQIEIYHRVFNNPDYYKNRFSTGLEYTITKHHEIDLGYKRDSEIANGKKSYFDVLAVKYKFSF